MQNLALLPRIGKDLTAGLVVFLVALPLCLGVALASQAPLASGLLAGIIGGLVVGALSGSSSSVSGPAAGLTAVVAAEIAALGSFEKFLTALAIAGVMQLLIGLFRLGSIAAFFPSSVIKGLLAAIGLILILKQVPHLIGHDKDPEGEMSFIQPDHENTFSELVKAFSDIHQGAAIIGVSLLVLLFAWDKIKTLKKSPIPAPLVVVLAGVAGAWLFSSWSDNPNWEVGTYHRVAVPIAQQLSELTKFLAFPEWSSITDSKVWFAATTIAIVASLETLLNLEAVDKLDPLRRNSPPNRELMAQGVGNLVAGLLGGIPVTSVIVRSSVNINAGARTKLSTLFHGFLLLVAVVTIPQALNLIPLAALAAILLHTGVKLCSPGLFKKQWDDGLSQFIPFVVTVTAIVLTDLLIGVSIGLVVAIGFILRTDLKAPVRQFREKHLSGEVLRIQFGDRVSFLNRASLLKVLEHLPENSSVLLDARTTDYIDPDVLDMLDEFRDRTAVAKKISVSTVGFQDRYRLDDHINYIDFTSRDLQRNVQPDQVLQALRDGNERFRSGRRLTRDLGRQVDATASGQFPIAAVLSCIDSRTPTEIIFDLGLGDVFTARIAGNVAKEKVWGSLEYACAVAGAKLVLVLGHTRCGAVTAAVDLFRTGKSACEATHCEHLDALVDEIQQSIDRSTLPKDDVYAGENKERYVDNVAKANVCRVMRGLTARSHTLEVLANQGQIRIVGGMYDVRTGSVEFFDVNGAPV